MKKLFAICLLAFTGIINLNAQSLSILSKSTANTGSLATARPVVTDASGNIYTIGEFSGTVVFGSYSVTSVGSYDVFVVKYNNAGTVQWAKRLGGSSSDYGYGLTIDNNAIYLTGYFSGTANFNTPSATGSNEITSAGSNDIFIAKYDLSGNYQWAKRAGGTGADIGYGIAVSSSGIFISGQIGNGNSNFNTPSSTGTNEITSAGSNDIFIAKYDLSGNYQWAKRAGGSNSDLSYGIAISGSSLYIAGQMGTGNSNFNSPSATGSNEITSAGSNDIFIAKYDIYGSFQWAKRAGGTGNDYAYGIAASGNNIYLCGNFSGTANFNTPSNATSNTIISNNSSQDVFVAKYDDAGNFNWARRAGGNSTDYCYAIACTNNAVFISGACIGVTDFNTPTSSLSNTITSAGGWDMFVAGFDANGNYSWSRRGGGTGSNDNGYGVTATSSAVFVTGTFIGTANFNTPSASGSNELTSNATDMFLAKYSLCNPTNNAVTQTQCGGNYTWNGVTYNTGGTYTYSYTNSGGCPSVDTLHLTINTGTHNVTNQSACTNYTWNGTTYTASGNYTYSYNDVNGCSSVDTLHLTIKNPSSSTNTISICSNMLPYLWNGLTFTTSGTQTAHLMNASGCDSAVTLTLSIKQPTASNTSIAYCPNQLPAVWNGLSITNAGTYVAYLINAAGCDSAATLIATVKAGPSANIDYTTGVNATNISVCTLGTTIQIANYTAGNGIWISSDTNIAVITSTSSFNRIANILVKASGSVVLSYGGITSTAGCPTTITTTMKVAPIAAPATITGNNTVCLNTPETFGNTTGNGVWSATRGSINNAGVYTPTSAGTGILTYTVTNAAGCSANATKSVLINTQPAMPTINFATGTTGITGTGGYCTNRTFTLVGTPAGGVWSKTGVINITSGGVVTTTSLTGAASATYTVTNAAGCSNSRTISTAIVACSPRGISTQSAMSNEQLVIYPNPAHDIINLNVRTLVGKGSIVLTDLYGKQLKQQPLSLGANTIDVGHFAKGMYLVSVVTELGKEIKKIVIE